HSDKPGTTTPAPRIRVETVPRVAVPPTPPAIAIVPGGPGPQGISREKDLEKRLDALMRELEQLRNEMKKSTGPKTPQAKPEEQGKLQRGAEIELRLIQAEAQQRALKELEAARRALDRFQSEDMRLRLKEVAKQQQDAEAAAI